MSTQDDEAVSALSDALTEMVREVAFEGSMNGRLPLRLRLSAAVAGTIARGTLDLAGLEAALNTHPSLQRHVDQNVGTGMSSQRFTIEQCATWLLSRYVEERDTGRPEDEIPALVAREVFDSLQSDQVHLRLCRPLFGVQLEGVDEITLSPGLSVRELSEIERSRAAQVLGLEALTPIPNPLVALVAAITVDKQIGPVPLGNNDVSGAREDLNIAANSLYVSDIGAFYADASMDVSGCPYADPGMTYGWDSPRFIDQYVVNRDSADRLRSVFTNLASDQARAWNALQVAVRRIRSSSRRAVRDDALVDLVIAAEALVLDDEAELKYKFALRSASVLSSESAERRTKFELFQRAYQLRNKVVHGSDKATVKQSFLDEFGTEVRALARLAAFQAAEGGATKGSLNTSDGWDDVVLGFPPKATELPPPHR